MLEIPTFGGAGGLDVAGPQILPTILWMAGSGRASGNNTQPEAVRDKKQRELEELTL